MTKLPGARPARWRAALSLTLLTGTLLLVVLLALQAQQAWSEHRRTAESVLRNYARLTADEFIRRASQEIGYRGYYADLAMLQQRLGAPGPALPNPEDLVPRGERNGPRPNALVRTIFVMDSSTDALETTGAPLDERTRAWLREEIRSGLLSEADPAAGLWAVHTNGDTGQRTFVATALPEEPGGDRRAAGFEVNTEELRAWFARVAEARPLLPSSLGDGGLTNDLLFLRLADATGRVLYESGTWPGPLLSIEAPLADAYSGIFKGLTLQVCIDPAAAPKLVIGGLPRSRLPVLGGLMLLTMGLVVASVWQLQRERALARMRSEFVSRVSHELRTPLTQIRMFAETLLLERTRGPEERKRSLEIIDQEARRLSHLVENILLFSRVERGTARLTLRPVPLSPLLRDLFEGFEPVARAKRSRVRAEIQDGITVLADEEAVKQVAINLLDNAVKYGPAGQEVRCELRKQGGAARLTVEDEGPGVPEGDRERIWDRWQRLRRDEERAVAGTGIGLTVVRDLIGMHEGRAWVESGTRGGACFVVEIPLADPTAAARAVGGGAA